MHKTEIRMGDINDFSSFVHCALCIVHYM